MPPPPPAHAPSVAPQQPPAAPSPPVPYLPPAQPQAPAPAVQQPQPPVQPAQPEAQPPAEPKRESRRDKRRARRAARSGGRKIDYLVGIPLGLIVGVGIVTAFVFLGSEGTIDAPRIDNPGQTGPVGATGAPAATGTTGPTAPATPTPPAVPTTLPVVTIIGGLPPDEAGGARIEGEVGEPVRFRVDADADYTIDVVDTRSGSPQTVFERLAPDGDVLSFTFDRAGQYSLFLAGSDINIGTLDITP